MAVTSAAIHVYLIDPVRYIVVCLIGPKQFDLVKTCFMIAGKSDVDTR